MFGLMDHVKTARHRARALAIRHGEEVAAYLPKQSVTYSFADTLPQGTQAKLADVQAHIADGRFDAAAGYIEAAYKQARITVPGTYEFECLAAPLFALIERAETPAQADAIMAQMQKWAKTSPDSAIASACYALACLHAGIAHHNESGANFIEDGDRTKLDAYADRGRFELIRTEARHSDHWFWCKADLQFAIHDYSDRRNHWARFERAMIAAPGSSDLYASFAHQLMPRWHGDYAQLAGLCEHAITQEDELTGLHNYAAILAALLPAEGDTCRELFRAAPLELLAQYYAVRPNDGDRTLAVNLFAWADNWRRVLDTVANIDVFHAHRWHSVDSLEYTIAYALVGLPSDERKRA